jgi:uncharacterized protein YkwD
MADDDASSDEEEFAKEGLRIHNEYRRKHGVPDLKLSKSVRKIIYLRHTDHDSEQLHSC